MSKTRQKPAKTSAPAAEPASLDDGALRFAVQSNGESFPGQLDLYEAKLICERAETQHNLPVQDGCYVPTAEFLRDLAGQLAAVSIPQITPSVAMQLWLRITAEFAALQKKMRETLKSPTGTA